MRKLLVTLNARGPSELRLTVTEAAVDLAGFAGRGTRVSVRSCDSGRRVDDRHLRADLGGEPRGCGRIADVLVCAGTTAAVEGAPPEVLYPGALVVATPLGDRCRLWLNSGRGDGHSLTLGPAHAAVLPWEVWASLAHAWLVSGLSPTELGLPATSGASPAEVSVLVGLAAGRTAGGHAPPSSGAAPGLRSASRSSRRRTSSACVWRPALE